MMISRKQVVCALAAATTMMNSCDKLTPNGQADTMSLLRAGSEKVCVAPDVQKPLRELILPKLDDAASSELREATKSFAVDFDLTTLQSTDKR